jgi:hypothetical protein
MAIVGCADDGGDVSADTQGDTSQPNDTDGDDTTVGDTSTSDDTSTSEDTSTSDDTSTPDDTSTSDDTSTPEDTTADTVSPLQDYSDFPGVMLLDNETRLHAITLLEGGDIVVVGEEASPQRVITRQFDGNGDTVTAGSWPFGRANKVHQLSNGKVMVAIQEKGDAQSDHSVSVHELVDGSLPRLMRYSLSQIEGYPGFVYNAPGSLFEYPNGDIGITAVGVPKGAGNERITYALRVTPAGAIASNVFLGQGAGVRAHGAISSAGHLVGCVTNVDPLPDDEDAIGALDVGLLKLNESDSSLVTGLAGSTEDDFCYGLAADDADGVVIVGRTDGIFTGDTQDGIDGFIARYDADFNELWAVQTVGQDQNNPNGVTIGDDGHIYVAGLTLFDGVGSKAWVASYTATGTERWTKTFGVGVGLTIAWDAVQYGDDLFVIGEFRQKDADTAFEGEPATSDIAGFVLRLDAATGVIR